MQVPESICAEWCSWSSWSCYHSNDYEMTCLPYRKRSCACPGPIGLQNTCKGSAEVFGDWSDLRKCMYKTWCNTRTTEAPWCQWTSWSGWGMIKQCSNKLERARQRQCDCAVKGDPSVCKIGMKEIDRQNNTSKACANSAYWGAWSSWHSCNGTCPSKKQSRTRECLMSLISVSTTFCVGSSTESETCCSNSIFSWILSHGAEIGGFLFIVVITVIAFAVRVLYYQRFQRRLQQRRAAAMQANGTSAPGAPGVSMDGVTSSSYSSAHMSYPRQAMPTAPSCDAGYSNAGFHPFLAPPPYSASGESSGQNEAPPPAYNDLYKGQAASACPVDGAEASPGEPNSSYAMYCTNPENTNFSTVNQNNDA